MIPVSVIIPTYNYAQFINKAIESVLSQTYSKALVQIIVIDDGSTDNTSDVLANYIANNTIEYYWQENKGKASATILGIQKVQGEIIFNLDADDEFLPNKITTTVALYQQYPDLSLVSSPAKILFSNSTHSIEPVPSFLLEKVNSGGSVMEYYLENDILYGGGTTFTTRASVLKDSHIPIDSDMYIDELLVYAALLKGNVFFTKEPLSVWNVHGSNYSSSAINRETLLAKTKRLEKSSNAVLSFLKCQNLTTNLIVLYELKHQIRMLSFKEQLAQKKITDIIMLIRFLIKNTSIPVTILYKYNTFQRLIPTNLLRIIKMLLAKR